MRTMHHASSRSLALSRSFLPWIVVLVNCLVILHLTLNPYRFQFAAVLSHDSVGGLILKFFNGPSDRNDMINNIILFLPLGLSLTWLMQRGGRKGLFATATPLFVGAGLSLMVELLQLFLPMRTSTPIDVLTNSLGALLGLLIFQAMQLVFRSPTHLAVTLAGWLVIALAVSIPLQSAARLSNWDSAFPLLIGNDRAFEEPWKGRIFDLAITDKSLTESQVQAFRRSPAEFNDTLLASYQFTGIGSYPDRTGTLPALVWSGRAPDMHVEPGVTLSDNAWLETHGSAAPLNRTIAQAGQFTILTTVAAADPEQESAIVSLSGDQALRNVTIGQEQDHLTMFLRTPITGESALHIPELFVPGVFADARPHQVIVTYDRGTIQFYIDGIRQPHAQIITPEYAFFGYLLPPQIASWMQHKLLNPDERYVLLYKLLYESLLFLPLGLLLALAMKRLPSRLDARMRAGLLLCGMVVPSILLEAERVLTGEQAIQLSNLVISLMLTVCAWAFFHMRTMSWDGDARGRSPAGARPKMFNPGRTPPTILE